MQYRRLGRSGLRLSELSLGSWITYHNKIDARGATEMLAAALDAGVNFFDNAEGYASGQSETVMGRALKALNRPRMDYVVSTKFYWGLTQGINGKNTLNRKYLMQAIDGSLARMQLDCIDLVYCHRPDPNTPIEETVGAMNDMIVQGKALYWGTSEWPAADIRTAWEIADKHHLHKPVMEQPEYNLFHRARVEQEYARLYEEIGLGLTTWSPLAGGLLTGKYKHGIPPGSRGAVAQAKFIVEPLTDPVKLAAVTQLEPIAVELGCTVAQLSLAWVVRNPRVSSAITGASNLAQFKSNLQALEVIPKLTDDVAARIDAISLPVAA